MRRVLVLAVVVVLLCSLVTPVAEAGPQHVVGVALGLASFAILAPVVLAHAVFAPPVYYPYPYPAYVEPPPTYYQQAYVQPAPQPYPAVIQYPHGRYELRGDGYRMPYQWVWIPNPPPPPAAPPPPPPSQ